MDQVSFSLNILSLAWSFLTEIFYNLLLLIVCMFPSSLMIDSLRAGSLSSVGVKESLHAFLWILNAASWCHAERAVKN